VSVCVYVCMCVCMKWRMSVCLFCFSSVCAGWMSVWDVVPVYFCCMAGFGLRLWWICVVFVACVVVVFVW